MYYCAEECIVRGSETPNRIISLPFLVKKSATIKKIDCKAKQEKACIMHIVEP